MEETKNTDGLEEVIEALNNQSKPRKSRAKKQEQEAPVKQDSYYQNEVKVKVEKMFDGVELPVYKHDGDACMDVRAYRVLSLKNEHGLEVSLSTMKANQIVMNAGWSAKIGTGLRFHIPKGWAIDVKGRSGLSFNEGVVVSNAPGKADGNYTGELIVLLLKVSKKTTTINMGDRIAQIEIVPQNKIILEECRIDENTDRGSNGIGSTGIKN